MSSLSLEAQRHEQRKAERLLYVRPVFVRGDNGSLDYQCDRCWAKIGQPCRTPRGRKTLPHDARIRAQLMDHLTAVRGMLE